MKFALKPLATCMATVFGAKWFNVWGAPPVQTQNTAQQSGSTTKTAGRTTADFKRRGLLREEKGNWVACDRRAFEAIANA